LDNIREFKQFLLNEYELEIDLAQIEAKENYNFVSQLTKIISLILITFSILSISMFVSHIFREHLQKNQKNLGTFKAFGLNNSVLKYIYLTIIYRFVFFALIVSYSLSFLFGNIGGIRLLISATRLKLEQNENYFNLLTNSTLLATIVIILVSFVTIYVISYKILTKTPDISNEIVGWIPKYTILLWTHRIAIEPNWDINSVNERIDKKISTAIYLIKSDAFDFTKNFKEEKLIKLWDDDPLYSRKPGNWFRFPVIDIDNSIIECYLPGYINSKEQNQQNDKNIQFGQLTEKAKSYVENLLAIEEFDYVRTNNISLCLKGFAPQNIVGLHNKLFRYVVLLSKYELAEFVQILNEINEDSSYFIPQEFWMKILRDKYGFINREIIFNLTLFDIHNMIFGLPIGNKSEIKRIKLRDLENCDESFLSWYKTKLSDLFFQLSETFNNSDFEYQFSLNDEQFYWIDYMLFY